MSGTALDGTWQWIQDDDPVSKGRPLDPGLQSLLGEPQATIRARTAEVARVLVAAQGEAKPVAPELTKEVGGDCENVGY